MKINQLISEVTIHQTWGNTGAEVSQLDFDSRIYAITKILGLRLWMPGELHMYSRFHTITAILP